MRYNSEYFSDDLLVFQVGLVPWVQTSIIDWVIITFGQVSNLTLSIGLDCGHSVHYRDTFALNWVDNDVSISDWGIFVQK